MKKIFTAIVLFALVVLPMSVMAMTTIADNELSTVTGQAGVSINIDVTANLTIGTIAWGDSDGFTGYTNAGFVGMQGMNLTVHLSGRHDGVYAGGANYLANKPITIDVGTSDAGASLVRIGIPTSHITVSTMNTNIFVSGATAGAPSSTTAQQLGSIYLQGVEVILGRGADAASMDAGYVTIGAAGAGNVGVNIGFNVLIDSVTIGTMSYGNSTSILAGSFGAAATGGYIGVRNFALDDVTIAGGVAIGIGTLNGTALGVASFGTQTMVNIVIANGTTIAIPGAITGTVTLASNQTLDAANASELGNFYIGGVTAQIVDNVGSFSSHSVIQIWAH